MFLPSERQLGGLGVLGYGKLRTRRGPTMPCFRVGFLLTLVALLAPSSSLRTTDDSDFGDLGPMNTFDELPAERRPAREAQAQPQVEMIELQEVASAPAGGCLLWRNWGARRG